MSEAMTSAPINRAQDQTDSGITAAETFLAFNSGYRSPHPSPPHSPKDSPAALDNDIAMLPASQVVIQQKPRSKRPRIVKSRQPEAAELEAMGIKVIDFGYTNTLPPVKGYRPRQFQPTPPGHRSLRREDTEPVIGESSQDSQPSQPLRHRDTEPIEDVFTAPPAPTAAILQPSTDISNIMEVEAPSGSPKFEKHISTPLISPNVSFQMPRPVAISPHQSVRPRRTQLKLRTDLFEHEKMFNPSPTTPISPRNTHTPIRTSSTHQVRREPSMTVPATIRPTKSRRKAHESQPAGPSRYVLRSQTAAAKVAATERKSSLRNHAAGGFEPMTLEARCPTSRRKRSETQAALPHYPEGRPTKRRRITRP